MNHTFDRGVVKHDQFVQQKPNHTGFVVIGALI